MWKKKEYYILTGIQEDSVHHTETLVWEKLRIKSNQAHFWNYRAYLAPPTNQTQFSFVCDLNFRDRIYKL